MWADTQINPIWLQLIGAARSHDCKTAITGISIISLIYGYGIISFDLKQTLINAFLMSKPQSLQDLKPIPQSLQDLKPIQSCQLFKTQIMFVLYDHTNCLNLK